MNVFSTFAAAFVFLAVFICSFLCDSAVDIDKYIR